MSKTTTSSKVKKQDREKRLTDKPIDKALETRVREKLITARIALLLKKPFFGNIATRMTLTAADEWCPTAATDGRRFYYNHQFVDSLRPKEVEFLVGHEILHVVYDHMERRNDRDPQLHNIAADYAVNLDLVDQKVGELITTVPALYDRKYSGWSSEQIYDDLFNNAKKINIQDLMDQLLDDHMDDDEGEGDGDGDGEGKGKRSGMPKLTDEEKREIKDEIRDAVLNAAKQCQAGDLPAGVQRLINELTEPKLNWREILRLKVESCILADYSWLVPSRKGWELDAIMPGMVVDQQVDLCVALDMSGSIGEEEIRDFLSEINGIMTQFDGYRIHV
jgi:predicted metal-dependent peptidase